MDDDDDYMMMDADDFYEDDGASFFSDDDEDGLQDDDGLDGAENEDDHVFHTTNDDMDDPFSLSDALTEAQPRQGTRRHEATDDAGSSQVDYKVWTTEDMTKARANDIAQCQAILGLDAWAVKVLLWKGKWNKERFIEQYMEMGRDKALKEANIVAQDLKDIPDPLPTPVTVELERTGNFTCEICYDSIEEGTGETMSVVTLNACGHAYCLDCWRTYLTMRITQEGEASPNLLCCPAEGCSMPIVESVVNEIVPEDVFEKYKRLLFRSYVDHIPYLKWCPAPSCSYAIECHVSQTSLDRLVPTVNCRCGMAWCFGCGEPDHRPITCDLLRRWSKKCRDDSETSNWLSANTKECTKCGATIEKNGGCNHMTCRKCKYEFCWVCMGPWSEHGSEWYNCNRYDEPSGAEARCTQAKSRASLERYLHYYNRYANHANSLRFEAELVATTENRMEELQRTTSLSWIEVQFLRRAADVLVSCRRVLQYTYAFAYYLARDSNATALFEDNQRDLEIAVESLAEWMERPIPTLGSASLSPLPSTPASPSATPGKKGKQKSSGSTSVSTTKLSASPGNTGMVLTSVESVTEALQTMKQQILDRTVYVKSRRSVLLKDVAAGLQEDRWRYNIDINSKQDITAGEPAVQPTSSASKSKSRRKS